MGKDNNNLYTLYEALKAENFDVPDSYDSFERTLNATDGTGESNRRILYESLKEENFDVPDNYESFSRTLFPSAESQSVPDADFKKRAAEIKATLPKEHFSGGAYSTLEDRQFHEGTGMPAAKKLTPIVEVTPEDYEEAKRERTQTDAPHAIGVDKPWETPNMHVRFNDAIGDFYVSTSELSASKSLKKWAMDNGRHEPFNVYMANRELGVVEKVSSDEVKDRLNSGWTYYGKPQEISGYSNDIAAVKAIMSGEGFDPEKLQQVKNSITGLGLDPNNIEHVMWVVSGNDKKILQYRLDDAEKRYRDLTARRNTEMERRRQASSDSHADTPNDPWYKRFGNFLMRVAHEAGDPIPTMAQAYRRSPVSGVPQNSSDYYDYDSDIKDVLSEILMLEHAKRVSQSAKKLKKSEGFAGGFFNVSNNWTNFWTGVQDKLADPDFWGMGTISLHHSERLSNLKEKLDRGAGLSDGDFALAYSSIVSNQAEANADLPHGYNAGAITTEMAPFMIQMAANPASGFTKMLTEKFGKSAAKKILLTIVGDVTEATVLANTLQAPATIADIEQRHLGQVTWDEDTFRFEGGDPWATAIAKGQGAAVIENYTELLGGHFSKIKGAVVKGGDKALRRIGVGSVLDQIGYLTTKVKSTSWAKAISNIEARAQWNGTIEEMLEEEAGIILNSIFVGDNRLSDLVDADQQIDIALGVGVFGGFVSGVKTVGYPVGKARANRALNKATSRGASLFSEDEWAAICEVISQADDTELSSAVVGACHVFSNSQEQDKAILDYANALSRARGYNLAELAQTEENANDTDGTLGADLNAITTSINDSYNSGYDAQTPREKNDARNMMEYQRGRVENEFEADFISQLDNDPVITLSDMTIENGFTQEQIDMAKDYVQAKAVHDGIMQRFEDDVEDDIADSNALIDSHINSSNGMLQPAVIGLDNKQVYIIDGDIVINNEGKIDLGASSESLIALDPSTGKKEFVAQKDIVSIGQQKDPSIEKANAAAAIRQEAKTSLEAAMRGKLTFNPGDVVTIQSNAGISDVTIIGGAVDKNGMPLAEMVTVQFEDGSQQAISREELQQMADAANQERLNGIIAQREEMRAQQRQQETQAEAEPKKESREVQRPELRLNDEFTILDQNGTPVSGTITRELDEDGTIEINTEEPLNGRRVNRLTPEEFFELVDTYNGKKAGVTEDESLTEEFTTKAPVAYDYYTSGVGQISSTDFFLTSVAGAFPRAMRAIEEIRRKYYGETTAEGASDAKVFVGSELGDRIKAEITEAVTGAYGNAREVEAVVDYMFENPTGLAPKDGNALTERIVALEGKEQNPSPLSQVPLDEAGNPKYDEVEPDLAWDAIVEQAEGDEGIAAEVIADEITDREKALRDAEKALKKIEEGKPEKRKAGDPAPTMAERIAAKTEAKKALADAQATRDEAQKAVDHWKNIASTLQRRQEAQQRAEREEARRLAEARAAEEARLKAEREEQERRGAIQDQRDTETRYKTGIEFQEQADKQASDAAERGGGSEERTPGAAGGHSERSDNQEEKSRQIDYKLSDEVDENGRQFVLTNSGNLEFGRIEAETGLAEAPILLSEGVITNPKTNAGYGLLHIEARHGDQIRELGYESVIDFIEDVAKNYETIREGKVRDGQQTYMLQLRDRDNNTLIVELSGDGTYWNINTAGVFRTSYGKNRTEVYNRHATEKQPAETVGASQDEQQGGTDTSSSMYAPTLPGGKDSEKTADGQTPAVEKNKKSVSASSSDIETEPKGKRNGTATPQNGRLHSEVQTAASKPHGLTSADKGNEKVGDVQIKEPTEAEVREAEEAERRRLSRIDKALAKVYDEVKGSEAAAARLGMSEPETMEEVAAWVLSGSKLLWSPKKDKYGRPIGVKRGVKEEVGFGEGERKKFFGMYASEEKGGQTIARLAEDAMKEACEAYGVKYDNQEAYNALIEVLRTAASPSDIRRFTAKRRAEEAMGIYEQEQKTLREMEESAFYEGMHMEKEEYDLYKETMDEAAREATENFDEVEYNGRIADELAEREARGLEELKKLAENFDESEIYGNIADENKLQYGQRTERETPGSSAGEAEGFRAVKPEGEGRADGRGGEIQPVEESDQRRGTVTDERGQGVLGRDRTQSADRQAELGDYAGTEGRRGRKVGPEVLNNTESDASGEAQTGAGEPGMGYRRRTPRSLTGKSLFDWRDKAEQQNLVDLMEETVESTPDKEDIFEQAARIAERENERLLEEAGTRANEGIDRFQEEYADYRNRLLDIDAEREEVRANLEEMRESLKEQEKLDATGQENKAEDLRVQIEEAEYRLESLDGDEAALDEQFAPNKERLEAELYNYYRLNNTEKDARDISRSVARRAMAEVELMGVEKSRAQEQHEGPTVAELGEQPEKESEGEIKTAGGTIGYKALGHLPDAEKGEFAYAERKFTLTGEFDFTGKDTIRDRGDVAFLFRSLEDKSIENIFAVYVKDGKPHIVHLGMGNQVSTVVDLTAVRAGYDAFGADMVYIVHNHPSGNLRTSPQDQQVIRKAEEMFPGARVEGLIIDTTSGKYASFTSMDGATEHVMPQGSGTEGSLSVHRFDAADRTGAEGLPEVKSRISGADDVVNFIKERRFEGQKKISYLILDNSNSIVGLFHTDHDSMRDEGLAEEMVSTTVKFNGKAVIPFSGNELMPEEVQGLKDSINELGGQEIKILDVMQVTSDMNLSAYSARIMEPGVEYGGSEVNRGPATGTHLERPGRGAYTDNEVSVDNDLISRNKGKSRFSKKRQAEWAAKERQRMANRISELAEKLHIDNIDILTDVSGLEGKRASAKGFFNRHTGKITIVIPNHLSMIDAEQTLLHETVAHYGLRKLFGKHFEDFLDNVYEAADPEIRRKIAEMAAQNGWDFKTATEEYLAGLAETIDKLDYEEGVPAWKRKEWWDRIKGMFVKMLDKLGFKGFRDSTGITLSDNELKYLLWISYQNLRRPGETKSLLGEAENVSKQYEWKVGNYAERGIEADYAAEPGETEAIGQRFDEAMENFDKHNFKQTQRFELGMPSKYLRSAGFPNLPISMRAKLLTNKSTMERHPFEAKELKGLVGAIQKPIAIFRYSKSNMRNLIVDLTHGGKHFLVGVTLNYKDGKIEINSVSGLFPKDNIEWLKWIQDKVKDPETGEEVSKVIRIDQKEKALAILDSQRTTNTVESERIGLKPDIVAKLIKDFENPTIEEEELFRPGDFSPRDKVYARDTYERMVGKGGYQFKEAVQDSMLGLKKLYQAILEGDTGMNSVTASRQKKGNFRIEDVAGFENAYLYENRMSSMNAGEQHESRRRRLRDGLLAGVGATRNEELRAAMACQKDPAQYFRYIILPKENKKEKKKRRI